MGKNTSKVVLFTFLVFLAFSSQLHAQGNSDLFSVIITIVDKPDDENEWLAVSNLVTDAPPYIADGTTMIPLRALAEGFGYNVDYEETDRKIIISESKGDNELVFTVDSTIVYRNGQADNLLQAPVIRENRTFIPLRYVSEFFDKFVTWRKGNNGTTMYIWVSSVQLLTSDDIADETDDNYYLSLSPDDLGLAVYVLKKGGQTYRGIKHGDCYKRVFELYGEPHRKTYQDGELRWVDYEAEGSAFSSRSILSFEFANGFVDDVRSL